MTEALHTVEIKQIDDRVELAIEKALAGKYLKKMAVGRGSYGQVWLVERCEDKKPFVAKIMSQEKKHRHEAEVRCLGGCDHFGVVKLVESCDSEFGPVIVLEYADRGDLAVEIKSRQQKGRHFTEDELGLIFLQLCLALQHLHSRRMLHRDVKAANVLLTRRGIVKLSDFGFSRQFDGTVSQGVADTFLGTPYYLAPELWKRQKYGKKADVWSLGIVLYEMITLKRPFVSNNMRGLMNCILQGEYELPSRVPYSDDFIQMLNAMLQVDPLRRTTVAEILETSIMRKYWSMFETIVKNATDLSETEKSDVAKDLIELKASIANAQKDDVVPEPEATSLDIKHEGPVSIGSTKDWRSRYLVLTETALVVTRVRDDRRSQELPLDSILSVNVANSASVDNVFVVSLATGYTVWMRTNTAEERDQWVRLISSAVKTLPTA
eukprot:GILI01010309.1.p1 GENE.GILI01010309.1~~GILI01010309.1.p1  ORF type:complete len:449 (+),score=58.23 GILI01010309.1:41-1348(+)